MRRFDKAYFDKWYRHPAHRVKSPAELRRQVTFVLAAADYILGRRVRTVLDAGAGEGQWQPELRRLRPSIRYHGVDASEYAVARFGARRNIQLGSIESLDEAALPERFDLVVCCGLLNYLEPRELRRGLAQLYDRSNGVAYLELFTRSDAVRGDWRKGDARRTAWYRRVLRDAGFVACGLHCYVPDWLEGETAALERA